jgi:hypothetical protein
MGSLEKLRKELKPFPMGISEADLARRTGLSKTTVNERMWNLENQTLAFKQGHLWFADKPSQPLSQTTEGQFNKEFWDQFWKELALVRELYIRDPLTAWLKLRLLIKTYPPLKDIMKPDIEKGDEQLLEIQIRPRFYGSFERLRAQQATREARKKVAFGLVTNLLDKLSTVLYQESERERKDLPKV